MFGEKISKKLKISHFRTSTTIKSAGKLKKYFNIDERLFKMKDEE